MGIVEALQLLAALAQLANSPEGRRVLSRLLDRGGMTVEDLLQLSKAIDSKPLPEVGSGS